MGLGRCGSGGNRALNNKGVHEEAAGNNFGVCHRDYNIQTMYRRG